MPTDSPLPVAPTVPTDTESKYPNDEEKQLGLESAMTEQAIDALDEVLLDIDPVMSRKIHLVNNVCHTATLVEDPDSRAPATEPED